jgi:peptidoglycan hydrolase CwlO-like protein
MSFDFNTLLQIIGLCGTLFAIFISLSIRATVNEAKQEFEEKIGNIKEDIGNLKADIGYLKGRIDSFEGRFSSLESRISASK